jgi:hypothetical protein
MNWLEKREYEKEFDSLLGRFVRNFAELESYVLYMWGLIEHPKAQGKIFIEKDRTLLEERRKNVTSYIHKTLPSFRLRWDRINSEINKLNQKRKFLVHATGHGDFYETYANFYTMGTGEVHKIEHKEIKALLNDLAELFTGDDGINGIFVNDFATERYNEYNRTTNEGKIIFKLNSKIVTEFKGE